MTEQVKVAVTPGRIQFILGMFAVVTIFWQAATYVNTQEFRAEASERKITAIELVSEMQEKRLNEINEKLIDRLDRLNDKITDIAIALKSNSDNDKKDIK